MRTDDGSLSLPGRRIVQGGATRIRRAFSAAPLLLKIVMLGALVLLLPFGLAILLPVLLLAALVYAPFAVSAAHRTVLASLAVAVWGVALVSGVSGGYKPWLSLLLLLPFGVVAAAHAGTLGRWFVPCRTVAWTLAWSLPIAMITWRLAESQPAIGPVVGWLIACVVLGWRLAKSWQEDREFGRQQARGGALAAPYGWPPDRAPRDGGPGTLTGPRPPTRTAGSRPPAGPGGRRPPGNSRTAAAEAVRAQHGTDGLPGPAGADDRSAARPPEITVDEAMAELDNMIGLTAVKDQIKSIAASIEARTTPSGCSSPQLTSCSFSWFFPKLSRLPKM